jgi:hypothetical protein
VGNAIRRLTRATAIASIFAESGAPRGLAVVRGLRQSTAAVLLRIAKRYAFGAFALGATFAYAIAHDQVTATISPEYFLQWKGLAAVPGPFRRAVTLVAIRASLAVGLLAGVTLVTANEALGGKAGPRVSYRALMCEAMLPIAAAASCAVAFGFGNAALEVGAPTARALVAPDRVRAFVTVWGIHWGSYVGALAGTCSAVARIIARGREVRRTGHA